VCNALYRTHTPTVLVATDRHIANEIQQSGYARLNRFYTRRPLKDLGALSVPQKYFGYSSGPNAVAIAAEDGNRRIYLAGFDMGPDVDGAFNNVFAGTEFYKVKGSSPTFTGNWTKQLQRIMSDYPKQEFVRLIGMTTADIPELKSVPNLKNMSMQEFLERINTSKDI
jgi:hypothetical protein